MRSSHNVSFSSLRIIKDVNGNKVRDYSVTPVTVPVFGVLTFLITNLKRFRRLLFVSGLRIIV